MSHPLNDLLIDLSNMSDLNIEVLGRKTYGDLFLTTARRGVHKTHDDEDIVFFADRYDHAFFKTADEYTSLKSQIDKRRVTRIKWILPIIQGKVANSEYWLVTENFREKRLYLCFGVGYVVWLEEREASGWKFSTAYTAELRRIRQYTKGNRKICTFK